MPFNPFTWNNSQPAPTQNISSGQATLLNDIQFLGSATGNVTPGFIQFPNGLIIQWGRTTTPVASGLVSFTFSGIGMQAFPNNCFIVVPVYRSNGNIAHGAACISNLNLTNAGFDLTSDGSTQGFYILAIGN